MDSQQIIPEYDVVYPNHKLELKNIERQFLPTSKHAGNPAQTLKYKAIPMCGHSFRPGSEPKHRNCQSCWFTFFQTHGELTQNVEKVYSEMGPDFLKSLKGVKFVDNFLKFMSTVAQYKQALEVSKEKNGIRTIGTEGGNGES